jgi:hypothetical protein
LLIFGDYNKRPFFGVIPNPVLKTQLILAKKHDLSQVTTYHLISKLVNKHTHQWRQVMKRFFPSNIMLIPFVVKHYEEESELEVNGEENTKDHLEDEVDCTES